MKPTPENGEAYDKLMLFDRAKEAELDLPKVSDWAMGKASTTIAPKTPQNHFYELGDKKYTPWYFEKVGSSSNQ